MKVFEDYFSELQADMVSICLEYSQKLVDDIYIYCSYEPEMYAADVFFRVNNEFAQLHQLSRVLFEEKRTSTVVENSKERMYAVLDIIIDDLKQIHKICKEYNRDMPTEMKLHYNVKQNSLEGKYRYDLVYSHDDELLPDDIFEIWYKQIKKEVEN